MHGKALEAAAEKKTVAGETNRIEGVNFIDGIITLLYSMLKEWEEAQICIDCIFTEQFLATILERIDFLNTSAIALSNITSH